MPSQFGSGSAIHAYFQEWVELGVFEELWRARLDRVRRAERHRLEVAERGRGDDQVAAGRGKKPGKTRPIAASWASSDRCSSTAVACRWPSPSKAPMCLTRSCWPRRSMALRSCVPSRPASEPQHLCLDKGYTGEPVEREVRQRGYTPHVPRKANEAPKPKHRRRQGSPLESRTHAFLAEPCPAAADPLGKESRQLPRLLASSIRHRRTTNRKVLG